MTSDDLKEIAPKLSDKVRLTRLQESDKVWGILCAS